MKRFLSTIVFVLLVGILFASFGAINNQTFAYIGQPCNVYNENPGNGCSNPSSEVCNPLTAESPSGNSTCVANTAPHVIQGGKCTRQVVAGTTYSPGSGAQGNCRDNLYCKLDNTSCTGTCSGTCTANFTGTGRLKFDKPAAAPCAPGALKDGKCTAVVTAFGRIGVEPGAFISRLFSILLAAAGGIAVILIMRAGYQIMTARGNPEGIKEGREKIVAAIVGLLFVIFSFVLLQVIGVDLLKIPQ